MFVERMTVTMTVISTFHRCSCEILSRIVPTYEEKKIPLFGKDMKKKKRVLPWLQQFYNYFREQLCNVVVNVSNFIIYIKNKYSKYKTCTYEHKKSCARITVLIASLFIIIKL